MGDYIVIDYKTTVAALFGRVERVRAMNTRESRRQSPNAVSPGTTGRTKSMFRNQRRPEIKKSEREHTPRAFALWLCDLAKRCTKVKSEVAA